MKKNIFIILALICLLFTSKIIFAANPTQTLKTPAHNCDSYIDEIEDANYFC
ncbi:MAG: hypothetical protein LBU14_04790 [Candidatus Peribacteria bacterium]|jgi:hypothetical protein|nr:hypothetical protein [Candidatus Peribacteria bacterium]